MSIRRAGTLAQLGVFLIDPATGSPLAIISNSLSINVGRWFGAVTPTIGQKTMANSIPMVIASNQTVIPVNLSTWLGSALPTVGQKVMASSIPVVLASDQSAPLPAVAELRAATLHVTAVGLVNAAVTATIPAAGVGLFHYFTKIELIKGYSVVGVAAGAGVTITSTNLPGNPAWSTEQLASAAGTRVRVIDYLGTTPLKSSVANTATTFVAPAQLQTIWRWNVSYFTAV